MQPRASAEKFSGRGGRGGGNGKKIEIRKKDRKIALKPLSTICVPSMKIQGSTAPCPPLPTPMNVTIISVCSQESLSKRYKEKTAVVTRERTALTFSKLVFCSVVQGIAKLLRLF